MSTSPASTFKLLSVQAEAELIRKHLALYAEPRGGTVKVLANMRHLWEEIFLLEEKPRILICYTGETARGEYEGNNRTRLFRVDRSWQVVVMRGHGFENIFSRETDDIFENFYDSVENIRDGCRCLMTISAEFPVNYRSVKPLPSAAPTQTANVFMDAYVIDFTTANDIPAVNPDGTLN